MRLFAEIIMLLHKDRKGQLLQASLTLLHHQAKATLLERGDVIPFRAQLSIQQL